METAADDPSIDWRQRLALHALTPEQKEAWWRGASEESLLLADGQSLRAYLEKRLTPPAGVYVALPVPCTLFASEGVEPGAQYGIRARGEDLSVQGGSASGCGIPAEATALILQLRLEARQPGRLKLWAGDGPEPAESVIQTEDWNVPVRQGTAVVTLAAEGTPEAELVLRATAASEVSGEVVGYFRALAARDQPGGRISFYMEGGNNNFFGTGAGANTTGGWNSFFGGYAGNANTTGSYNSFFGSSAGGSNTTGYENSFFGRLAGYYNTTGSYNSFFCRLAGRYNTTGNHNSFFGAQAGVSNTVEHNNSFIGALSNGAAGITNATALGYRAQVSQSNSLVLGSIAGVNGADAYVNVGIGTQQPNRQLHLAGPNAVFRMDRTVDTASFLLVRTSASGVPWKTFLVGTNSSGSNQGEFIINDMGAAVGGAGSRRMTITNTGAVQFTGTVSAAGFINTSSLGYKTNVRTFDHALETVNRLRGVRFDWKESGEPAVGLIAEEVAEVIPEVVALEGGAPSGVSYANLVAVLVEAVKEQQTELNVLKAKIERLEAMLEKKEENRTEF
jgi:hypothetical protein